jgi:hypothetical protein
VNNDDYRDFESEDIDRAQYAAELEEERDTMNPNETLRLMREAMQTYLQGEATRDREVMADAASDLYTHAAALDTWLSRGGFLPDAWRQTLPETIHNMTPGELSDVRDAHTYGKRPE